MPREYIVIFDVYLSIRGEAFFLITWYSLLDM